jgi:hypothetical protein
MSEKLAIVSPSTRLENTWLRMEKSAFQPVIVSLSGSKEAKNLLESPWRGTERSANLHPCKESLSLR